MIYDNFCIFNTKNLPSKLQKKLFFYFPVAMGRPNSSLTSRSVTPEPASRSRLPRSQSALENYARDTPMSLNLPLRSRSVLDKPIVTHG